MRAQLSHLSQTGSNLGTQRKVSVSVHPKARPQGGDYDTSRSAVQRSSSPHRRRYVKNDCPTGATFTELGSVVNPSSSTRRTGSSEQSDLAMRFSLPGTRPSSVASFLPQWRILGEGHNRACPSSQISRQNNIIK